MRYYLLALKFLTPVHFGDAANGGGLEKVSFTCSADTFFSALCNEAATFSQAAAERLIAKFSAGEIQISSLLPYCKNKDDEMQFYLPKPLLPVERPIAEAASFEDMKREANKLKKSKKSAYVRASQMQNFLKAEVFAEETPDFAVPVLFTKVNTRGDEPLPYHIASYRFAEKAGLYFVCGVENENIFQEFKELTISLGLSGIGGKRSSGYGKFELAEDEIELESGCGCYEDDEALTAMLFAVDCAWQMCIAPVCPQPENADCIKQGAYKLLKRSGFVASPLLTAEIKRKSVYMLAEGSCLPERIKGALLKQSLPGLPHDVYRNGMGMFVGLQNDK